MTDDHETQARAELTAWREKMLKPPGLWDQATRGTQDRINAMIPERVHQIVTAGVEAMSKGILTGSEWTTQKPQLTGDLAEREAKVRERIALYRNTAGVEGGIAGAGGFLMAAADFPALMAIKVKLMSEISTLYGWGGSAPRERLFLLHIFHLAFASARRRPEALKALEDWMDEPAPDLASYDWRRFQIEYRDYIDLAKLAQLLPVVGAPIGAVVNWRLTDRLGETAMMAGRMRWFAERG